MLIKIGKYYLKHKLMIRNFKDSEEVAKANYEAAGFSDRVVRLYKAAWEFMPKYYEGKMLAIEERIKKWIRKTALKLFGVTLSDREVDEIYREAISGITPVE